MRTVRWPYLHDLGVAATDLRAALPLTKFDVGEGGVCDSIDKHLSICKSRPIQVAYEKIFHAESQF